ncbi:MAG: extracellular solute-binding protein [Eubacteriales bacterium]|nr:extracellular solute-binding protein [Eubacteriales bacterium]
MKRKICLCMAGLLAVSLAGCSGSGSTKLLDPKNPITLTIWHYYNGNQQSAFDSLVDEFNETEGKDKGIFIQSYSQGAVDSLEAAVMSSIKGEVGADEVPDIFSSYADTAYSIEEMGKLADITQYLSEEELDEYVDAYIEEGRIAKDGSLRIFPVAKSTEIMMVNKTDWDAFANETGVTMEELATFEGVTKVAQQYYEWTDAQTPDIPNDGKAFYGRDSMANYFVIGVRQQGKEIFQADKGKVTLNIDKEYIRRLWDNYYIPYIKGYFASYGKFRSDDVKTGDLLAFTGSITASMYFPDQVETGTESYPIDYAVLPAPVLEGGEPYMVQQGAGMVVSKSDEAHEFAAVTFLKWFTKAENNLKFACSSGYLPVKKEAVDKEKLDQVIAKDNLEIPEKTYDCLTSILGEENPDLLYTTKAFSSGFAARKVLDYNLSDKAAADREVIKEALDKGGSLEEVCAPYLTEEAFDSWYEGFKDALTEIIEQK